MKIMDKKTDVFSLEGSWKTAWLRKLCCLSVIFLCLTAHVFAQGQTVSGTVVDSSGEAIIGASISVKGTTNGSISDIDGNFTISAAPNATILITYLGYISQEVIATPGKKIHIVLQEDNKMLDEVVIVGFGVQKKVNLTGSVGVATAKDIESRPVQNAVAALQGLVPGLNISNSGQGTLDAEKSINIRGMTTIGTSSGSPLVLIDGMEDNLSRINPQDIESISVLKDAAASAIYGSRAPFGVILVTTKSGSEGKTVINYNNSFRYSKPINMPEMSNSWEFINNFNDAQMNHNGQRFRYFTTKDLNGNYFSDLVKQYYDGELDPLDTMRPKADGSWNHDYSFGNVNWMDEYYKDWSSSQEHNVSISGGSKSVNYYLSANYMDQDGLLKVGDDNYKRYAFTGKFGAKLNDYITLNYTSRFSRIEYDRPTTFGDGAGFYGNVVRRARPVRPILDPNGLPQNDVNYLWMLENGGRNVDEKDVFANQFKVTITPLKNWNIIGELNMRINSNWAKVDSQMGYSYKNDGVTQLRGALSPTKSSIYEYSYKALYLNPNIYSNYNFTLSDKHNFGVTAGFQAEHFDTKDLSGKRFNLISDEYPILNLTTTNELSDIEAGGQYQRWRTVGFFGRLNYDYEGKYLVELNGRYDGSSRFRKGSRMVFSPSFSLGWNIAREAFFESLTDYVSILKPRFSYGQLANQNTNNWYPTYTAMTIYGADANSWLIEGNKHQTAYAPGLVSSTLTWEKVRTTNIGLDFGVLNNRLTGSFDYFVRKSLDMVGAGVKLPATLGVGVPSTNNLDLKSYGWELQVSWKDQIKDFNYGVTFNIADAQSKVTKYPNPTNSLGAYRTNEVTGNIYGYKTLGIAKSQEEMDAHLANADQSKLGSNWGEGDIMYQDTNGDGVVDNGDDTRDNPGDLRVIGNSTARYRVGLNINMEYKGIDFQMFWQGVLKRDWMPEERAAIFWGTIDQGDWHSIAYRPHLDYYRSENTESALGANTNSYYPRPTWSSKNHKAQTGYIQDASYLRLKNLQIGYTLPKDLTRKIGIDKLRVYVSGENLLTLTDLVDVMDPESVGIGQGYGNTYPMSAIYSFGLSVNF